MEDFLQFWLHVKFREADLEELVDTLEGLVDTSAESRMCAILQLALLKHILIFIILYTSEI